MNLLCIKHLLLRHNPSFLSATTFSVNPTKVWSHTVFSFKVPHWGTHLNENMHQQQDRETHRHCLGAQRTANVSVAAARDPQYITPGICQSFDVKIGESGEERNASVHSFREDVLISLHNTDFFKKCASLTTQKSDTEKLIVAPPTDCSTPMRKSKLLMTSHSLLRLLKLHPLPSEWTFPPFLKHQAEVLLPSASSSSS